MFLAVFKSIPIGDAAKDYLNQYVNPTLLTGLTELCKRKPADPFVRVIEQYILNQLCPLPYFFEILVLFINYFLHFVLCYFSSLQTWLADWLMENNPNKPKVSLRVEIKETAWITNKLLLSECTSVNFFIASELLHYKIIIFIHNFDNSFVLQIICRVIWSNLYIQG